MKKLIIILILCSGFHLFSDEIKVSDLNFYIEAKGSFFSFKNGDYGKFIDSAKNGSDKKKGNYAFEIGLSLNRYTFGIEAGFFNREFSATEAFGTGDADVKKFLNTNSYKTTYFMLNNRVKVIDLEKIRVYAKFGVGVFIGNFKFSESVEYTDEDTDPRLQSLDAKKAAPGFQFGLSADFKLNRTFAVIAEAQYRIVRLGEIEGNMDYKGTKSSGDILLLKEKNSGRQLYWIGNWSTDHFTGDKAVFKINGLVVNLGVRIYL